MLPSIVYRSGNCSRMSSTLIVPKAWCSTRSELDEQIREYGAQTLRTLEHGSKSPSENTLLAWSTEHGMSSSLI